MGSHRDRVIKTTGNIGIYSPHVFHMSSGTNQSYSPEYDWECLSPLSTVRRREEQPDQRMGLIESYQSIELIKSNQGMILIN